MDPLTIAILVGAGLYGGSNILHSILGHRAETARTKGELGLAEKQMKATQEAMRRLFTEKTARGEDLWRKVERMTAMGKTERKEERMFQRLQDTRSQQFALLMGLLGQASQPPQFPRQAPSSVANYLMRR